MKIGVIGGSGLYQLEGVSELRELACETPFGAPSDVLMAGRLGDVEVVFLPRHGRGHRISPSELNHRANIFALKSLGVERILSVSAVGSFREDLSPGHVVLVDQFVDRTKRSADHTFFSGGIVAHVSLAEPICAAVREAVYGAAREVVASDSSGRDVQVHNGGVYLNMEGPAFSTRAESMLYKSWGMDIIGMTNLAEAKLAREAEMCYCTIAMVTDYDCWHETHENVTVEMVIQTLHRNVALARAILARAVPAVAACAADGCGCAEALQHAIITDPKSVPRELKKALAPIIGRIMPA